jgi:hypothetical protein
MFLSLILFACSSTKSIERKIENFYIESAEKILKENGLTGEVKMILERELDEYSDGIYSGSYNLLVTSTDFESLTDEQKLSFIDELGEIRFDDYKCVLVVYEDVKSNGNTYSSYGHNGRLWKDNTQIFPPISDSYYPSSSSSSSSSSSTCDTLWDNLDAALLLSGGETTDLTVYYTKALMDNDCFDIDD